MKRRRPDEMSKLERAKLLLVSGAVSDQDFKDLGLDPVEGRQIQAQIVSDTERVNNSSTPERTFALMTLEIESHISALVALRDDLIRTRQHAGAIGAIKAALSARRHWLKAGQDLGLIKRQEVRHVFISLSDKELRSKAEATADNILRLVKQLEVPIDEMELPPLGSAAPNLLEAKSTASKLRANVSEVLDAEPAFVSKRAVDDDPFPGD